MKVKLPGQLACWIDDRREDSFCIFLPSQIEDCPAAFGQIAVSIYPTAVLIEKTSQAPEVCRSTCQKGYMVLPGEIVLTPHIPLRPKAAKILA
jgi:hypothetical protein